MKQMKLSSLIIAVVGITTATAQKAESTVFINVLIDADQKIIVEQDLVNFNEVTDAVKAIIYDQPFRIDQKLIYRIYADENLSLGVIMDVENEMFKAMEEGVGRERYLLNTKKVNPDGQDWLQKVRQLDLKRVDID